jgi:hypothetical protein
MRSIILLVCAALLLLSCSATPTEHGLEHQREPPTPRVDSSPRYVAQLSGRGENENGVSFSFHTYKGPDGQKIITKFEAYDAEPAGEERFGKIVKSAMKVIEVGPLADQNGSPVGKRALLENHSSDTSKLKFKLLLRFGSRVHAVDAESLEDLQEFEKEYIPSVFRL